MAASDTEIPGAVGVSVSESPDLRVLGLSDGHLRDAMAEIALDLLASGRSVAYDGDLRDNGFNELLHELICRYRDHPRHSGTIVVTDYLAWPVHIRMAPDALATFSAEHEAAVRLVFLARDGARLAKEQCLKLPAREPDADEWADGLTAMRTFMRSETRARIVLGGLVDSYKGVMPGIAEEAHLSLQARHPLYLIGGFGGCARDIAETIGLCDRWAGSRGEWAGRKHFRIYTPDDLHNGLSGEENLVLARTPHIEKAVALVSRGLRRIDRKGISGSESIHQLSP